MCTKKFRIKQKSIGMEAIGPLQSNSVILLGQRKGLQTEYECMNNLRENTSGEN